MLHFLPLLFLLVLTSTTSTDPTYLSTLPPDPSALLLFKSKSDLDNKLLYTTKTQSNFCQWQGVKCAQGRVVRYVIQTINLRGTFPAGSLSKLDQLRVLILRNNNLSGPIPDLSSLINLKTLLIDHNSFSGEFPASLLSLHRLVILDLSFNNFTGELPVSLTGLDQLNSLRLDSNRFYGPIPALNQTDLSTFNVSSNNFSGPLPVTSTLKKFKVNSFLYNPNLCGNVINKPCKESPFFNSSGEASSPSPLLTEQSQQGISIVSPPAGEKRHHKKVGLILGFLTGSLILVAAVLSIVALIRRRREEKEEMEGEVKEKEENNFPDEIETTGISSKVQKDVTVFSPPPRVEIANAAIEKMMVKSGRLLFCSGDEEVYTLEQLMRASAELLGRGTIGTTYKAVMADQFVVSVKRLDAGKTAITSGDAFEQHLEKVGMLRHPNLVPIRAYFQAKQERLVIFDYQRNGSLFNLIHGSRSSRAKPLHWTSCLKIAEDVAQGLAYIHQASTFVHGNLKSSNILLGSDFEACITDYCLAMLADTSSDEDPDFLAYKAPEIRKSSRKASAKSDVYAFGVLLLELLTGKPPAQHPFLAPPDMPDWVRAMREDNSEDDTRLRMLVEVASICSMTSPEQRPTMWQVLKMITNVKEIMDDSSRDVLDYS